MKITEKLPQFESEPTLIIVTGGKKEAQIYLAVDGRIDQRNAFRAHIREFTDKEGAYRSYGRQGSARIEGSILNEHHREEVIKKFLSQLQEKIKQRIGEHKPKRIIIFSPKHIVDRVRDNVPTAHQKKIAHVFHGNFETKHPFDLLKKIQQAEMDRVVTPHSTEAAKLLHKGERGQNKRT